jgi:hypothetical protein
MSISELLKSSANAFFFRKCNLSNYDEHVTCSDLFFGEKRITEIEINKYIENYFVLNL